MRKFCLVDHFILCNRHLFFDLIMTFVERRNVVVFFNMRNIVAQWFLSKCLSQSLLIHLFLNYFFHFFSMRFLNLCVCHSHDFRFCLFVRLVLLPDFLCLLFRIIVNITRCFIKGKRLLLLHFSMHLFKL